MLTKAQIQLVKSLSDKKARYENGLFVVEGRKMVAEAVASGAPVERIYVVDTRNNVGDGNAVNDAVGLREGANAACEYGVPAALTETVSGKDMERMSHLKTPADILALVRMPDAAHGAVEYGTQSLVLFLDGVQDPGNMGTIIRIADWFGIEEIVCSPDSADCYNPKVVQATMGALFRVRVRYAPLAGLLERAAGRGVEVYGTFLEGGDIYDATLSCNGIILMGSEGRGVSDEAARFVTRKLFIPPYPKSRRGSESLNVAVATAVACAEFRRRG